MTTEKIDNVALTTKANVYFDGKCVSHGFTLADGTKKSVGVVLPASLTFSAIEKEAIIHAARVTSGRVQEMAQLLNIGRTTLWRKMKHYDIDAGQFKRGRME